MPSPIRTLALAVLLTLAPAATAAPAATPAPLQQLRIYEIPRANEGVFHDRFQDHALRIMARHGFAVRSLWRSEHEGKVEFVYLLGIGRAYVGTPVTNAQLGFSLLL